MDLSDLQDAELIDLIVTQIQIEKQAKAAAEPLRAELLKRQRDSGEVSISHNGYVSRLKKEPFSAAWLERQWGYTQKDLLPECFTQKLSEVIDWEKVNGFMIEHHGHPLEPTHSLVVEREKTKK